MRMKSTGVLQDIKKDDRGAIVDKPWQLTEVVFKKRTSPKYGDTEWRSLEWAF